MLQCFKPLPMDALLFQGPVHPFHHAILLRSMRCDELLFQPVASDQGCEAAAGKDQAVVRSQQKRSCYSAKGAVSGNQGLLQGGFSSLGFTRAGQMPAQKLPVMAVNDQGKGCTAISASPDPAQIGRPPFIRGCGYRGHGLHPGSKPNRSLFDLPATELEDPLGGVFVKSQEAGYCPISKRGLLLDHGLNRRLKPFLNPGLSLVGPVIDRSPDDFEPAAELGHQHLDSVFFQSLFDGRDHFSSPPNREFNFFRARSSSIASPYASCSSLNCRSYCSLISKGLALRAFSMPCLPSSTHSSISEGSKSKDRDTSAIKVLSWMISIIRAAFPLAVQRLKYSSKITLTGCSFLKYDLCRKSVGHYPRSVTLKRLSKQNKMNTWRASKVMLSTGFITIGEKQRSTFRSICSESNIALFTEKTFLPNLNI